MGVLFNCNCVGVRHANRAPPRPIPGPMRRVGIRSFIKHARPDGKLGASVGGAIGTGMTDHRQDYRGYQINIIRHAAGCRTAIYAPDSNQPMLGPQSDDATDYNEILDKAKHLIDALLSSPRRRRSTSR